MARIFRGQTSFRLTCTIGVDITGATVKQVRFKKPSTTTGAWDATVVTNSTAGIFYIDGSTTVYPNEGGVWTFWSFITFSDGRSAPGAAVQQRVYIAGEDA